MAKDQIADALKKVTDHQDIHLETPDFEEHGDYSSNIAMQIKGQNPRKTAEEIIEKLKKDKKLDKIVDRIEVAGPGFINFYLSDKYLADNLSKIEESYGNNSSGKGKRIIVEYSSPNIAKPFTVGHLRSTIIGDAVANLLSASGFTVYRDNHLGDWGTQFGKQIYAIKTWGDINKIEKSKEPIKELVALYVKFHEEAEKDPSIEEAGRMWFKKLEDGDHEARELWKKCIDWSLKEFSNIYKKLGVKFTENGGLGYGESFFEDKMPEVIDELNKEKLLKESKGAKLIFYPKDKYPPLMIIKSDGATLYATRDLATDKFRLKHYGKDIIVINETGVEQDLYWKQIFEAEQMLGWYKPGQRINIAHGLVRLTEGKMSTRKGNTIWLEDVISEAETRAYDLSRDDTRNINYHPEHKSQTKKANLLKHTMGEEEARKNSMLVAIGAIKWNDLKRDPKQDITFDWDEILNMQGNSGPYLQYTYARTQSVLKKGKAIKKFNNECENTLYAEEKSVLRLLLMFPEVVEKAATTYSPSSLCTYLYNLAQKYNTFYNKHKVIGSQKEEFRLKLTTAVGIVLKNGLSLLGIESPEKM